MRRIVVYLSGYDQKEDKAKDFFSGLDKSDFDVEFVNLSKAKDRLFEAEKHGVKALPAIMIDGKPCYFNVEMTLNDFKEMIARMSHDQGTRT